MSTPNEEVQYYRELWKKEKSNVTNLSHFVNQVKMMVNECKEEPLSKTTIQLINILSENKLL